MAALPLLSSFNFPKQPPSPIFLFSFPIPHSLLILFCSYHNGSNSRARTHLQTTVSFKPPLFHHDLQITSVPSQFYHHHLFPAIAQSKQFKAAANKTRLQLKPLHQFKPKNPKPATTINQSHKAQTSASINFTAPNSRSPAHHRASAN